MHYAWWVLKRDSHFVFPLDPSLKQEMAKNLQQRVKYFTSSTSHYNDQLYSHGRGVYKNYSAEALSSAMQALDEGFSFRRVSEMYNIPISTLHDYHSGKSKFGTRCGPNPYLNFEEEEELASFLINTARIGFPHTKKQVFTIVETILKSRDQHNSIKISVTNGWWERFMKRHPHLTVKSAVPLGIHRAKATDPDVFYRYYNMLEECLKENDIFDKPSCIFNCDETGLVFSPPCFKVVDAKGSRSISHVTSGDKSKATVLAFVDATGIAYPPMIIFGLKLYNPKVAEGEVPGTAYANADKSWISAEIFRHWFEEHFLEYIPSTRPVLLLLDGHSSHYSPATIKLAAENKIILFALPPHTTHISQPLDRCCFSPLKSTWRHVCHAFYHANPGRCVTKYEFSRLFHDAWDQAMTGPNITSGFRATGVYPFNKNAIVPNEDVYTQFEPANLAERTGLSYIPLYSPSRTKFSSQKSMPATSPPDQSKPASLQFPANSNDLSKPASPLLLPSTTGLSKFLPKIIPCSKLPTKSQKSAGTIYTGWKYRKEQEEKEQKKKEELAQKQQRRMEREYKRKVKKLGM